jgi:hypothetical protein
MKQWRNVISGGPRFKIFEGPAPSRSAKGTSWAPYMHEFSRGARACTCSRGKLLNLESPKCHFLDFGERVYTILMVRKRHCNISESSLANVFALQPEPGGPPIWPIGVGAPGFARSEPTVVTPLIWLWSRPFQPVLWICLGNDQGSEGTPQWKAKHTCESTKVAAFLRKCLPKQWEQ